jgi:uncharacterized protein (DUF1684 family)
LSEHLQHEVNNFRAEKDGYFRSDPDSPISHEERSRFKGLKYFPPNAAYRVKARLVRIERPDIITLTTSKGTTQPYLRYGVFNFELDGRKLRLQCYKAASNPHETSLFTPFTDETTGRETYGSGRYLDIEETGRDDYVLDFNLAYNPYCAYSENYVCPFPPKENRLSMKVLAGEKNYK